MYSADDCQDDAGRFSQHGPPVVRRDIRADLVATYKQDIVHVTRLLSEADPIGIAFSGNDEEYEPEARTIVARLASFHHDLSVDNVLAIVHQEFVAWFGESIAGPASAYRALAHELLQYWNARPDGELG